jgi:hypothetical protein
MEVHRAHQKVGSPAPGAFCAPSPHLPVPLTSHPGVLTWALGVVQVLPVTTELCDQDLMGSVHPCLFWVFPELVPLKPLPGLSSKGSGDKEALGEFTCKQ